MQRTGDEAGHAPATGERVLIVEDDPAARVGLEQLLRSWGYDASAAEDGERALAMVPRVQPSIVLTDLIMPTLDGLGLLRALRASGSDAIVVLMTAQGTVDSAVSAMKDGAVDYLTKPLAMERLQAVLASAATRVQAGREVQALRRQLRDRGRFGSLIGTSPAMRQLYAVVEQAAPTRATVLITGASGTGKELVAQTIHQLSPRASGPFVAINCAAIPDALLESEIFGHERGSFTGALDRHLGCFEQADHGTLFLDEIAEMSPAMQVKLLRVLQEQRFRRIGGRVELSVDVRVIAATNRDLEEVLRTGAMREDLFYRLNVFTLVLPPLQERREDIPLLVYAFLDEFNDRHGKAVRDISSDAMQRLRQHDWPGNVRELRNVVERATILATGGTIERRHLPDTLQAGPPAAGPASDHEAAWTDPRGRDARLVAGMTVDEAERRLIVLTLAHTGDNKTRAAEILGISLKTLHNKLNRMQLRPASGGAVPTSPPQA